MAAPKKKGLGRGLEALFEEISVEIPEEKETVKNAPQIIIYVNNFFGDVKDSQIQEGTKQSSQIMK